MEVDKILKREDAEKLLADNIKGNILIIPREFKEIDTEAFAEMDKAMCSTQKLINLFIPNTVMIIGIRAFQNARFIKKLIFEERDIPIEIRENAFYGNALKYVDFPLNVIIGESAFSNSRLKSICFKNGEKKVKGEKRKAGIIIKEKAFSECVSLTSIYFSSKAKVKIGTRAFEYVGIEELDVKCEYEIGIQAFANCTNLKIANIKCCSSVTYEVFLNCINLESITFEHEKAKGIVFADKAFSECVKLTVVELKNCWITEIFDYCFNKCQNLKVIDLSKTIHIRNGAFFNCYSLERVNCSHVKSIGNYAFTECLGLKEVILSNKNLYIGKYAFAATSIVSIFLSNQLTRIEECSFKGCKELTILNIPISVEEIDTNAFENCINLEKVVFAHKSKLKVVGIGSFKGCINLLRITFPKGVNKIGSEAFSECFSLRKISFKEDALQLNIDELAFFNCTSLDDFVFPCDTQRIGDSAFENCIHLEQIVFKGGWPNYFGANVFKGCNVKNINFNEKM